MGGGRKTGTSAAASKSSASAATASAAAKANVSIAAAAAAAATAANKSLKPASLYPLSAPAPIAMAPAVSPAPVPAASASVTTTWPQGATGSSSVSAPAPGLFTTPTVHFAPAPVGGGGGSGGFPAPGGSGGSGGGGPPGGGGGGGGGGGVPPGLGGVVPIGGPIFALTPGQHNPAAFLDYGTRGDTAKYNQAAAALPVIFDGEPDGVLDFSENIENRGIESGWYEPAANVMVVNCARPAVPPMVGIVNFAFDILTAFEQVSEEECEAHVRTYHVMQTRQAQNDVQFYYCVWNSLNDSSRSKILTESRRYVLNGIPSGVMLFKVLMVEILIDTRAAATMVRQRLAHLDTYMVSVAYDVSKFNLYVKQQRKMLARRGESSHDLLNYLFEAFEVVDDSDFRQHIKRKKDDYEEGADMTPDGLMATALNKYQTLLDKKAWRQKSTEQQQIVALTSSVKQLKDGNLELSKALKKIKSNKSSPSTGKASSQSSTTSSSNTGTGGGGGGGNGSNNSGSGKGGNRGNRSPVDYTDPKYAWKKVPPESGKPTTITKNKKEYHWCPHHKLWCLHKPDECKLKGGASHQANSAVTTQEEKDTVNLVTAVQAYLRE